MTSRHFSRRVAWFACLEARLYCPFILFFFPAQMSTLMGGQTDATEDMFSKLESMRAVITEVNTQFKDPVRVSFVQ